MHRLKSFTSKKILRWELGSGPKEEQDALASEEPLEIRIDNHPISVTMRTPGNDDELAVGFLLSEGLLKSQDSVAKIEPHPRNQNNIINVFLAPDVSVDLKQLRRNVFVSSSCGLCGKASIESVHQHFRKVKSGLEVSAKMLLQVPTRLRSCQETFARTGGLHAAAIFDAAGKVIVAREDVGRHNAVDKVLGYGFLNGLLPFKDHILAVSGRASFEIMQKALAARIPIVSAVSAPSNLAVEFAQKSGQTLVGFIRGDRLNVYSGSKRVNFESATNPAKG